MGVFNVVDSGNVGMVEQRGSLGFAQEARFFVLVPQRLRREESERDCALQPRVLGFVARIFNLMFYIPTFQRPSASLFIGARAR